MPVVIGVIKFNNNFEQLKDEIGLPKWEFQDDSLIADKKVIVGPNKNGDIEVLDKYPEYINENFIAIDTDVDYLIDFDEEVLYVYNPSTLETVKEIEIRSDIEGILAIGQSGIEFYHAQKDQYEQLDFASLSESEKEMFSYENVMNFLNILSIIVIAIIIVCVFISVLFGIFVQTIIALIQQNGKATNSFGKLFKMAVYARTIPTVIVALSGILSISIPFGFIINFVIGGIYMHMAIKETVNADAYLQAQIRNNNINNDSLPVGETDKSQFNTPFNNSGYSNSGDYGTNNGFNSDDNK